MVYLEEIGEQQLSGSRGPVLMSVVWHGLPCARCLFKITWDDVYIMLMPRKCVWRVVQIRMSLHSRGVKKPAGSGGDSLG